MNFYYHRDFADFKTNYFVLEIILDYFCTAPTNTIFRTTEQGQHFFGYEIFIANNMRKKILMTVKLLFLHFHDFRIGI